MTAVFFSLLAGSVSVLSPCVLPVLPVVVASALHRHARGPLALAAGLVVSSTAVGLLFASFGLAIGLDREVTRAAIGVIMTALGIALLAPRLAAPALALLAHVLAPITRPATVATGRLPATLLGHFILGLLLGVVWLPCTGPTLAAAVALASHGESIGRAAAVMLAFGVGTSAPLLILAYGSRRVVPAHRAGFAAVGRLGKPAMGAALLLVGVLTLTGSDKRLEAAVTDRMPEWLLQVTTRF